MASGMGHPGGPVTLLGVVPVLISPLLQVLIPVLAGLAVAMATALVSLLKPRAMKAALVLLWRLKGPLILTLLVLGGAVWAARTYWPLGGPAAGEAEAAGDWPVFRGGLARRGAAAGSAEPSRGGILWAWTKGEPAFFSSPALVGNRVYLTTASLGVFGGGGEILCLDADTGGMVWRAEPDGYRATFSSPVVSGRRLVCGEGLHDTRDARVLCLDLTPGREGQVLWTFRTASHVECAPVVWNGRVIVGAGDDGYYCFDLEPGPNGQARVLWHLPGEAYPDAETSLAVHDGKVYAGLGLGGKALCVLDAETGRELKRIPTPYPVFSPPAIAHGSLYLGMGNGDYVRSAEEARAATLDRLRKEGKTDADLAAIEPTLGPGGEVWRLDLETLEVRWKFKVPQTVLGAVAVTDDAVYFGSRDGRLYAVSLDGTLLGTFDTHAPIVNSPAVTKRHVYVMNGAGTLYAVDRRSMEPVWEVAVGTEPLFISSPTVARGHVYVGTQADGFVCAGEAGEDRPARLWPGHLGGPGAAGLLDGSPLPKRGAFLWQYPADQSGQTTAALVTAPAAVLDGRLYVPLAGGPAPGVACLPVAGGTDKTPKPVWTCRTANGVHRSPAVSGDRLFVVDGKAGDAGRQLHGVDAVSGAPLWQAPVAAEASGAFVVTPDMVLVQDGADALTALSTGGKRLWSRAVGRMDRAPGAGESMAVAATVNPPALVAMDLPTGRELWRVPLEAAPTTSPALDKAVLFVGTVRGLEVRSLVNGSPEAGWNAGGGGVSGDFALGRDVIAYVSDKGELVVVKRQDGATVARVGGAVAGLSPVLSRDTVFYFGENALMQLALGEGEPVPEAWTDTSWLGRPAAPMVAGGSRLYAGMAGWGLVCLGAGR